MGTTTFPLMCNLIHASELFIIAAFRFTWTDIIRKGLPKLIFIAREIFITLNHGITLVWFVFNIFYYSIINSFLCHLSVYLTLAGPQRNGLGERAFL